MSSQKADVARALVNFVDKVKDATNKHFTENFNNNWLSDVSIESGRKYARVYIMSGIDSIDNKRIFAFVDVNTGDIFKPATWRAPAKHARGNVLSDENGMEAVSVGGSPHIKYMR